MVWQLRLGELGHGGASWVTVWLVRRGELWLVAVSCGMVG